MPNSQSLSGQQERFERVAPLFDGLFGTSYVGWFRSDGQSERPVLLRPVPVAVAQRISQLLPVFEVLSRPSATRIVGLAELGAERYVASDFLEGVTLLELEQAARAAGKPIPVSVAVRAVRDALAAAHAAQALLADIGGIVLRCTLTADSIWLSHTSGRVYVTELGIVAGLAAAEGEAGERHARLIETNPVRAAGLELRRLLGSRSLAPGDKSPSGALSRIIDTAMDNRPGRRFAGPATMAEALSLLPSTMVADTFDVRRELSNLVGKVLARRRELLGPCPDPSYLADPVDEDRTRQFDVSAIAPSLLGMGSQRPQIQELPDIPDVLPFMTDPPEDEATCLYDAAAVLASTRAETARPSAPRGSEPQAAAGEPLAVPRAPRLPQDFQEPTSSAVRRRPESERVASRLSPPTTALTPHAPTPVPETKSEAASLPTKRPANRIQKEVPPAELPAESALPSTIVTDFELPSVVLRSEDGEEDAPTRLYMRIGADDGDGSVIDVRRLSLAEAVATHADRDPDTTITQISVARRKERKTRRGASVLLLALGLLLVAGAVMLYEPGWAEWARTILGRALDTL